ncbi:MAG TPA: hypothetical protein VH639_20380 [Bryobacteraceae bacterium]
MKPVLVAILPLSLALPAMSAVDPALLNLAMPDAQALTGVLVDQVQSSPFGQYVLSQIQIDPALNQIMSATGFDPRKDLHEIVAASASTPGQPPTGLVVGRGVFQPSRISAAAVLAGAVSSNYNGIAILTASNNQANPNGPALPTASAAFLDATIVVLGDTASVKGAIDRHIAGATFSGPLAQKAMEVSAGNDIWFVTAQSPASFFSGKTPDQGLGNLVNAFQAIQQTSGGVKFASGGVTASLALVARSAQDAQALVDVGKFLANLVQTNRGQNAGAAKAATLADSAVFSANGPVATVSLSLPEEQLEQLLMPAQTPHRRGRALAKTAR